jgi:SNF2 family DNA or RNA helicase
MTDWQHQTDALAFQNMTDWQHQADALAFADGKRALMLAMDMGTGKSKVAVELCLSRAHEKVLIAAPLSALGVWPREFNKWAPEYRVVVLDGPVKKKRRDAEAALNLAEARQDRVVLVVNHESLWREPFGSWAIKVQWDAIIIDESHRAKSPKGRLSKFLDLLAATHDRTTRLMLTGTPMPHSPLDIWAQYRFIDDCIFGKSFWKFKNRYAAMGGYLNKQVLYFRNQDEMHERMYRRAFRVTKDVLSLPSEVSVDRNFELDKHTRRLYDSMEHDFYAAVDTGEITAANALVQLLRLQQLTGGHVTDDSGDTVTTGTAKVKVLADLLEDIDTPVVVFCRFRSDLDAARAVCEAAGRKTGEVSGRHKDLTNGAEYPPHLHALVVQMQAGGAGIDLSRASTAIYFSVGFSLGDYKQSQSRLHRPGQRSNVTYVHLVASKTVDEKVYGALKRRENIVESILGERNA